MKYVVIVGIYPSSRVTLWMVAACVTYVTLRHMWHKYYTALLTPNIIPACLKHLNFQHYWADVGVIDSRKCFHNNTS